MSSAGHPPHRSAVQQADETATSARAGQTRGRRHRRAPQPAAGAAAAAAAQDAVGARDHEAADDERRSRSRSRAARRRRQRRERSLMRVEGKMTAALANRKKLNDWLVKLGRQAQPTLTQAKRELRTVYISIFDLVDERFEQQKDSLSALRKYLHRNRDRIFPLDRARNEGLKEFLKKIW